MQIAQVPSRHEPDTAGEINYSYIFDLLQKFEYTGYIGLEYKPEGTFHSPGSFWGFAFHCLKLFSNRFYKCK